MAKKLKGFRANMTDEEFDKYLTYIKQINEDEIIYNDEDEYTRLFKKYDPSEKLTEAEYDKEYLERSAKAIEELENKWNKWKLPIAKKCFHFGEVNIFNLVPITCSGFKTDELLKLIKEKNIKSWLILDISCLLNLDIDKLDLKFYFAPIDDFSVPSFKTMDDIIQFVAENTKIGNMLVSCMGGHGRTGTVLSIWSGLHDIEKPVDYVRKTYCEEAVETVSQEMFVNIYLKYLRNL